MPFRPADHTGVVLLAITAIAITSILVALAGDSASIFAAVFALLAAAALRATKIDQRKNTSPPEKSPPKPTTKRAPRRVDNDKQGHEDQIATHKKKRLPSPEKGSDT